MTRNDRIGPELSTRFQDGFQVTPCFCRDSEGLTAKFVCFRVSDESRPSPCGKAAAGQRDEFNPWTWAALVLTCKVCIKLEALRSKGTYCFQEVLTSSDLIIKLLLKQRWKITAQSLFPRLPCCSAESQGWWALSASALPCRLQVGTTAWAIGMLQ